MKTLIEACTDCDGRLIGDKDNKWVHIEPIRHEQHLWRKEITGSGNTNKMVFEDRVCPGK